MSAATRCVHRWRIGEPNGPTSLGLCSLCGVSREFRNWQDEEPSPVRTGEVKPCPECGRELASHLVTAHRRAHVAGRASSTARQAVTS